MFFLYSSKLFTLDLPHIGKLWSRYQLGDGKIRIKLYKQLRIGAALYDERMKNDKRAFIHERGVRGFKA